MEHAEFEGDFDFGSAEQRVTKLLETGLAIKRVDRAMALARYAETLAAGLMVPGAPAPAFGASLQDAARKAESELGTRIEGIEERIKTIGSPTDDQQRKELEGLRIQLTTAKRELEEARAAISFAAKLKEAENALDGKSGGEASRSQLQLLLDHSTGETTEARGVRARLPAAWAAAQKATGTPPTDELGKAALAQQTQSLSAAATTATKINALEDSIAADSQTVAARLEVMKQPEQKRSDAGKAMLAALDEFDYLKDSQARDPYHFAVEPSVKLLNRRAQLRALYVKKYEADAGVRFDGPGGILESKMLDGSYRYGIFRITRHFITITILIVMLVVVSLFTAAAAQGAAEDVKGPLSKPFFSTITVDDLVMRFTEIMLTIPTIYLILAVLALFQRDVYIVMAVIGLTSWMGTTRFVRAEILSLREQDFIQAARALGVSDYRIVWRHLVPNAISPVLVSATLMVATAVLAESTLSFLGIGAGPDQPTWGQILSNGRAYITDASWLTWIPGVAILITVLSFNLLGEGLREAFNPKLRGR
jgi:ABC-type methionine transport system permease subunit